MTDHEHKVRFPPRDNITDGVGQRQRFYRDLVSKINFLVNILQKSNPIDQFRF